MNYIKVVYICTTFTDVIVVNKSKTECCSVQVIYLLSGEPDYFGRNEISSGGDLSHYSSASLY